MTRVNSIIQTLAIIAVSYYSAKLFVGLNNFAYVLYGLTSISKVLPFTVVIMAFWVMLGMFIIFAFVIVRDTQMGLNFILIYMPMSALPFILLGIPQAALNHVFICRSSVIIFTLFLVVSWFLRNSVTKEHRIVMPFAINILIFLFLYSMRIFTVDPLLRSSVLQACFVMTVIGFFFYFVIAWANDHEKINNIIKVLAASCIAQTILSFLSYYYYVVLKGEDAYSFSGLLRDYELFAEYLVIHIPLFVYLIRNETHKTMKQIYIYGLCLMIFVLTATAVRGAIGSLVVGMAYYFFNLRKITKVSHIIKIVVISVIICGCALIAVYQFIPASARIIERFIETDLSTGDSRRYVWLNFFDHFKQKPLLGHGMFYNLPSAYLFWPHSAYFYYILTIGIVGFMNYLSLLLGIFRKGFENLKINRLTPKNFELSLALNCAVLICVIDGLKVDYQRYSNYQLFVWTLFALIVAVNQLKYKTQQVNAHA